MRKQYHFRQSDRGLLAWDIHRLIALSKNLEVVTIPLSAINELDEAYWYEEGNNAPTCRDIAGHAKLINEVSLDYPILLFSDNRVADGMHRVCRALMDGKSTILARVFATDPAPDFVGISPDELSY